MKVNVHYESTVRGFVPRVTVEMSAEEAEHLRSIQATRAAVDTSNDFTDQLQLGLERIDLDTAARERGKRTLDKRGDL